MTADGLQFEWDPRKAASNLAKHGITFESAIKVFDDDRVLIEADLFAVDEYREIATGLTSDGLLVVVYTERRDHVIRIISARRAGPRERRVYRDYRRP
jgi:uncharacterized DUF497 family protein